MGGWVKWWRSAELNPVINRKNEPFDRYHAFMWLVESAATQDTTRLGVQLERGQLVVSERWLASVWKWKSRAKVRKFLEELERAGMVKIAKPKKDQQKDQKKTIINVENYALYQDSASTKRPTKRPKSVPNNKKKEGERETGSLEAPRIAYQEGDPRYISRGMGEADEW